MADAAEILIANNARSQSPAELESLRAEKMETLRKLRFKKALEGAQTVSVKSHQLHNLRRDIAVINTVLGEHARGDLKMKKVAGDAPKKAKPAKAEKAPAKAEKAVKEAKPKATKADKAEKADKAPAKKPRAKKGE